MSARFSARRSQRSPAPGLPPIAAAGDGAPLRARVIAAHGRLLRVRTADGAESLARPPGRDLQVVCGD